MVSKPMKLSEAKKRAKVQGNYISGVKDELKKVSWTTKEELKLFSKIVIGATFTFGIGIYIADLVMKGALDGLGLIVRSIWG